VTGNTTSGNLSQVFISSYTTGAYLVWVTQCSCYKSWFEGHLLLLLRGVSKNFGEWYQKTNKTEDTNKLTLLAFKIIFILHNTLLATFIKLLETVSKGCGLLSVSSPEEHHERRMFCRRGGNPRTCDSGSAIDS
jgi:hypothetical protein